MDIALVEEFEFDWVLSGKSKLTAQKYAYDLKKFFTLHPSPNLNDANLNCANLSNANLTSANLTSANLIDANLHGANLHGAIMPDSWKHDE